MESEERLPGVTLWLERAEQQASDTHLARVIVVLNADIDSFELWDEVEKKFNGMRIYESDDFKSEMIEMLQEDGSRLENELEAAKGEIHTHKQTMEQQLDMAKADNHRLDFALRQRTAELEAANKELAELRAWKKELDALSGL